MTAVIVKFKKKGGSGVEATKVNGKTEAAEEKKHDDEDAEASSVDEASDEANSPSGSSACGSTQQDALS